MPLPAGVETVTVSSGVPMTLPDGTWIQGKLTFTFVDLATVAEDDFAFGGGVEVDLVDGEWSVTLVANDATGINPSGGAYMVTPEFTNAPNWDPRYVQLLKASPSVKFADVVIPDPIAATYTVLADPSTLLAKAQNLADVPDKAAARTALGLGSAAQQATSAFDASGAAAAALAAAVGDAASKYVALTGNQVILGEKTFNDAIPVLPATNPAFDNQAARKAYVDAMSAVVGAVTVSGAASSGKVLTATSSSAATWQTPSGGGGSADRTARVRIVDDSLVANWAEPGSTWTIAQTSAATKLQCSIAASAGDRIELYPNFMRVGGFYMDWALLDSAGAIAVFASTESASQPPEGNPALYPSLSFSYATSADEFTVGAEHLAGGLATIALVYRGTGSGRAYAHTSYPFRLRLKNIAAQPA